MFTKLDTSVEEYTEKINDLDGRLTTQVNITFIYLYLQNRYEINI